MSSTVALSLFRLQPKTRLWLKQFGCFTLHCAKRHNISDMIRSVIPRFNCGLFFPRWRGQGVVNAFFVIPLHAASHKKSCPGVWDGGGGRHTGEGRYPEQFVIPAQAGIQDKKL